MKSIYFLSAACFALLAGTGHYVMAAPCTGNPMTEQQILDTLDNKSIFAKNLTTQEEWKEDHCDNGKLYKVGDPNNLMVDPRAEKGSWTTSSPSPSMGLVEYTYFGQPPLTFKFKMFNDGGTIMFCSMAFMPQRVGTIQSTSGLTGACL